MKSICNDDFWKHHDELPLDIQALAKKCYRLWDENLQHPSIRFKKVKPPNVWSARIGDHYRALCTFEGDTVVWFYVGHHSEVDRLLNG